MATCAHSQMLRQVPRNISRLSTIEFPSHAFVPPSLETRTRCPPRLRRAALLNLPAELHRLISRYFPRDSLHEMAIFAVSLHDFSLDVYCHEASKQSCGKLLQRALREQIPLQSFHHLLQLCPKNDLARVVLRGSEKDGYEAVSMTWFGCSIPCLQSWYTSSLSNLDKAVIYPRRHPFAYLNPIDIAAACSECFPSSGASPVWFQPFRRSSTRPVYLVY